MAVKTQDGGQKLIKTFQKHTFACSYLYEIRLLFSSNFWEYNSITKH